MAEKNQIQLSSSQSLQVKLMGELEKASEESGIKVTEYGRRCVVNGIATLLTMCKTQDIEMRDIDPTMLRIAIQSIGFTELNTAAIPSEVYFDLRKRADGMYSIKARPQGAGNETLVRKYGVDVKELKNPMLVHEGDEFTLPSYDGLTITPPKFRPKFENMNKKIILVVYPLIKKSGDVEWLISSREGIKPNIIAQIRQNTLYNFKKKGIDGKPLRDNKGKEIIDEEKRAEFYRQVDEDAERMNVDELIKAYAEEINPTYTSGGSKEQMVLRKMKNNALKNYPRNFDTTIVKEAVENMFEDVDESLIEEKKRNAIDAEILVEKTEKEIEENPQGAPVPDFVVAEPFKQEEPQPQPVTVGKTEETLEDGDLPF